MIVTYEINDILVTSKYALTICKNKEKKKKKNVSFSFPIKRIADVQQVDKIIRTPNVYTIFFLLISASVCF